MNVERDIKNLEIYETKIKEIQGNINVPNVQNTKEIVVNNILTKKQFIETKYSELKKDFPNLTDKQLDTRIKLLWKNRK